MVPARVNFWIKLLLGQIVISALRRLSSNNPPSPCPYLHIMAELMLKADMISDHIR